MAAPQRTTRRMMAPEVVQTSAMDCGPASLKCLLEGFGVPVSYGRLREACQTDVDGTSIDTLEDVAQQLGLDAEQVMLPVDHLLLPGAETLPALVVVTLPSGMTHFVVAWRTVAGFVQVMDPSTGRRWPSRARFLEEVYTHAMPVPAAAWRQFAAGPGFQAALTQRMRALGVGAPRAAALFAEASASPGWQALGALDAATRMVSALVEAGALRAGAHTAGVLAGLAARAKAAADSDGGPVPEGYWSVRPEEDTAEPALRMKGAVLLRVKGLRGPATEADATEAGAPLSPELAAALHEPPVRAGRALWGFLREDGLLTPTALLGAFAATALGAMVEVLLFRGLFELGRYLGLFAQRMMALAALGVFLLTLLMLELPVMAALQRLGRGLDARLRVAFLAKIPRLGDRYFRSRPTSDMAERAHTLHQLRALPDLGARVVQTVLGLVVTTAGIAWLDPQSAPAAAAVALLGVTLPLLTQPLIGERDMRFRVHGGALTRFYLDALQGLMAVRTHGAERALRREHESLLVEWARAGRALQRAVLAVEALQGLASAALTVWLVTRYLDRAGDASGVLLLLFWALSLPAVGQELATLIRQYPAQRNVALRLLEPLGAPDEHGSVAAPVAPLAPRAPDAPAGVSLSLHGVTVRAGGTPSWRGSTSRWRRAPTSRWWARRGRANRASWGCSWGGTGPPRGRCWSMVKRLTESASRPCARSRPGSTPPCSSGTARFSTTSATAPRRTRRRRWRPSSTTPTSVGCCSACPTGSRACWARAAGSCRGEGQRVRLGRAMMRADARLVILDEPFRGLDRDRRRALLGRARARWRSATMLCITHDVGETRQFDRVLVVEGGRVVEDGAPSVLAAREGSRYRALLDADEAVRHGLWTDRAWRRLRLDAGRLSEAGEADPAAPPPGRPAVSASLGDLLWPASRLGEALEQLARHGRLSPRAVEMPTPPPGADTVPVGVLDRWVNDGATWLGLEAEAVRLPYADVADMVRGAGPALLHVPWEGASRLLLLVGPGRDRVPVLGPDGACVGWTQRRYARPSAPTWRRTCATTSTPCSPGRACPRVVGALRCARCCGSASGRCPSPGAGCCACRRGRAFARRWSPRGCTVASRPWWARSSRSTPWPCSGGGWWATGRWRGGSTGGCSRAGPCCCLPSCPCGWCPCGRQGS